ncbi:winged helix-turn-helix domain-containing protein [Methanoregula sp. UBA64]|jgi:predicted transcriptional regulator|uniref:winged helix-turn-helix domain-containing protein n=1 Tax=Methanoregula sp. UBA64 TaxID=1915554 RepID=UPI0025ECC780|nr:winged helix-turn-helix domain-containing protein [Methanoregula sp. UBA64]
MDDELIKGISVVKSSKHRQEILEIINNEILTPSEISKKSNLRLNHVSMYLNDLKTFNLVECLNEDTRKGRLYSISTLGKRVIVMINTGVKDE